MEKLDLLVFAAHPDDAELCCGGTIAKLAGQGKKVGVIDLTRGEMGSRGTPEQRLKEARKAGEVTGLAVRRNLELKDTLLRNTREHQRTVIRQVRRYRPHICFVGAPGDRHPDHGDGTRLVLDALFYSGLTKIETEDENGEQQSRWRPAHILHYMQDRTFEPDLVFDITDTFETKKKAILAFDSQFNVSDPGKEPETYISSETFFKGIEARARHYGHLIGATYGEPFKYHNGPIPFGSLDALFETDPQR